MILQKSLNTNNHNPNRYIYFPDSCLPVQLFKCNKQDTQFIVHDGHRFRYWNVEWI